MQLATYADWVRGRWQNNRRQPFDFNRELTIAGLGIGGEAGEVQEHVKKFVRDGKQPDRNELKLELGDVIHYAIRLGQMFGIEAPEILEANVGKLTERDIRGKK